LLLARLILAATYLSASPIVIEAIHLTIRLNFIAGSGSERSGGSAAPERRGTSRQ
jgi:hypothetical protein